MNYELGIRGRPLKLFLVFFVFIIFNSLFLIPVYAATNIVADTPFAVPPEYNQWAWNDVVGWINWCGTDGVQACGSNDNVFVKSDRIEGYGSSGVGFIALDCATTPMGDACGAGAGTWRVTNDASGNLAGWAWNENIGWISFSSATSGGVISYSVTINPATGEFSGWAWNDVVGWISFNYTNVGAGGSIHYITKTTSGNNVSTGMLVSSVFDVGSDDGASLNAISWRGIQPNGTAVKFQIASAPCSNGATNYSACNSGAWSFIGPDATSATYYQPIGPGLGKEILGHYNKRYFRYKLFVATDNWQSYSPRVDDVIINYSP